MPKRTRTQRWQSAAELASRGLHELLEVQEEYAQWQDNLPESLQESALADRLAVVLELDVQYALDIAEEAAVMDLPLGFGRD